jgi:intein-encoded DNA endonuclease-like protein
MRAADEAMKNQDVKTDIENMETKLKNGHPSPGIGRRYLGDGLIEHREKSGGRIITREKGDGVVEILGKSGKKPSNQDYVIKRTKEVFSEK